MSSQTTNPYMLFRPRVNEILHNACAYPLVTITAGTGYGKSQALRDFVEREGIQNIWLQLTTLDNYPTRFWEIFTHAMSSMNPALAVQMAEIGFPETLEKTYQFLRGLSQAIYRHEHCIVVLDDFHKIEDASIINLIENIIFARLENLTVVLLSRFPMPIHYSSLYDNGLLSHISVTDLRFTEQETQQYFKHIGLQFSPEVLDNIQRSTEGWPLALYLIGLHRQNDGQLFNDPIACTIPLLYSLIEVEIFSHYPKEIQEYLVKLALLDNIPMGLAKQLCGKHFPAVSDILQNNQFVHYNPSTGQYYFHRLFRRFLRAKQEFFAAEELLEFYRVAGDWHAAHEQKIEALTYYKLCGSNEGMWGIILEYAHSPYDPVMAKVCHSLCQEFPPEFTEANPIVRALEAHFLLDMGEIERAYQTFKQLKSEFESLPPTPERLAIVGEAAIGLAHASIFKRDYAFAEYYRLAGECLPNGSILLAPTVPYVGNHNAIFMFESSEGALQRIVDLLFEIRPIASRVMNYCGYGAEYLSAAEAAYYQGNYALATQHAYQGVYRGEEKQQHDIILNSYFLLMRIHFVEGEYTKCTEQLHRIKTYKDTALGQNIQALADIAEGWFMVALGQPDKLATWVRAAEVDPKTRSVISLGREKNIYAQYLLYKGKYYDSLALLDTMERYFEFTNAYFLLLQTHILRALTYLRLQNAQEVLLSFKTCYEMAYYNHLITAFVEFGADMCELVAFIKEQDVEGFVVEFLDEIHCGAAIYAKRRSLLMHKHQLANGNNRPQLTPREKEVLAKLCIGMKREEIASVFGISINTVKTLLKSIFAKLGALNQADAVRIAMAEGILNVENA